MNYRARYAAGLVFSTWALNELLTINTLECIEDGKPASKKILSILRMPFIDPKPGELVLTLNKNQSYVFKQVTTESNSYSSMSFGASHYVPKGFVMLRDLRTGKMSIECIGVIVAQYNFDLSFLF